jgi:hypothetical protein
MGRYWGAVQEVSDRNGGTYRLPGRPWHFSRDGVPGVVAQADRMRRSKTPT